MVSQVKIFSTYYDEVSNFLKSSKVLDHLKVSFNKCLNDKERVACVLNVEKICHEAVDKCFKPKSQGLAIERRKEGNVFYSRRVFDSAIKAYTESCQASVMCSEEHALALANRSAVFFAVGKFLSCLLDINSALKCSYPSKLQYKLHDRAGRCHVHMENFVAAQESFQKALVSLDYSELGSSECQKIKESISEQIIKIRSAASNKLISKQHSSLKEHPVPPTIPFQDRHSIYPSCSAALQIQCSSTEGRYGVATRDIKAGDVLAVERPFAHVLLPQCFGTHCFHCVIPLDHSFPCRLCRTVLYCSEDCEKQSWSLYHKYECAYLDLLTASDIGLGHLAFRMVVREGFVKLKEFERRLSNHRNSSSTRKDLNEKGLYDPSDYLCCFYLIGNSEKRHASDLFRKTLIAVHLAKVFLQVELQIADGSCPRDDVILVSTHILKQIQMLPCNAHEISELLIDEKVIGNSVLKEIGSAIYATLSLLNHSCDPSVVRHSYGSSCVLRAIKHIRKGEAIVDNYGHLYAVEAKPARLSHLMDQYFFACQCRACTGNWPLYEELPQDVEPIFLCHLCLKPIVGGAGLECTWCASSLTREHVAEFGTLRSYYQKSCAAVLSGDKAVNEHLSCLLSYLDWISHYTAQPWIDVNNCQELVKQCFGMLSNTNTLLK